MHKLSHLPTLVIGWHILDIFDLTSESPQVLVLCRRILQEALGVLREASLVTCIALASKRDSNTLYSSSFVW